MHKMMRVASSMGVIFLIGSGLFYFCPEHLAKSDERIVKLWQRYPDHGLNQLAYWKHSIAFSSFFYTQGQLQRLTSLTDVCRLTDPQHPLYFVVDTHAISDLQTTLHTTVEQLGAVKTRNDTDLLVKVTHVNC